MSRRRRRGPDLDPERRVEVAKEEMVGFVSAILGMVDASTQAIDA